MIPVIFFPLDCFRRGACRQFNVTRTKAYCMMSLQQKPCHSQVASNQPFGQAYCLLILRSVESHRDRFYVTQDKSLWVSVTGFFYQSASVFPFLGLSSIWNGHWTGLLTSVWTCGRWKLHWLGVNDVAVRTYEADQQLRLDATEILDIVHWTVALLSMLFWSLVWWLVLCLDTLRCFFWGGGGDDGVFIVCTDLSFETGGSNRDANLKPALAQRNRWLHCNMNRYVTPYHGVVALT
jgi:hypothetical protein